jgi:hypothetical protein
MKNEKNDLKERTRDFALRVIKLYSALPSSAVAQVLVLVSSCCALALRSVQIIAKRTALVRRRSLSPKWATA